MSLYSLRLLISHFFVILMRCSSFQSKVTYSYTQISLNGMWWTFAINSTLDLSAPDGMFSGPSAFSLLICLMPIMIFSVIDGLYVLPRCPVSGTGLFKSYSKNFTYMFLYSRHSPYGSQTLLKDFLFLRPNTFDRLHMCCRALNLVYYIPQTLSSIYYIAVRYFPLWQLCPLPWGPSPPDTLKLVFLQCYCSQTHASELNIKSLRRLAFNM